MTYNERNGESEKKKKYAVEIRRHAKTRNSLLPHASYGT